MPKIKSILLVCTGNSCRSVMASGLLKNLLAAQGQYQISSAGTAAMKGMPPTAEAVQIMAEQGVDISGHRSTPLTEEMIQQADLILVMQNKHREKVLAWVPAAKDKVHLLTEYGRIEEEDRLVSPDIPDPIGQPLAFYRQTFEIIREALLRTVKEISKGE